MNIDELLDVMDETLEEAVNLRSSPAASAWWMWRRCAISSTISA